MGAGGAAAKRGAVSVHLGRQQKVRRCAADAQPVGQEAEEDVQGGGGEVPQQPQEVAAVPKPWIKGRGERSSN